MTIKKCNICGREFDIWDAQEGFHIGNSSDDVIGYGSRHDGERCECDLCVDCFDRLMEAIEFTINPFSEEIYDEEDQV